MPYISDILLAQGMAHWDFPCAICLETIEIGDTYYTDILLVPDGKAKKYCERCVREERQI